MSPSSLAARKRALAATATISLAVAGLALAPVTAYAAATPTFTLSQTSGPQLGGNSITLTAASAVFNTTAANNYIQWQWAKDAKASCASKYQNAATTSSTGGVLVQATNTKTKFNPLSTKKAVIQVPAPGTTTATNGANTVVTYDGTGLVPANATYTYVTNGQAFVSTTLPTATQNWLICAYSSTDTNTSTLLAGGLYAVAPAPSLTSVSPAGGPALGGGTVTLSGSNLTGASVKVGSVTVTPVVVATGGASLTFAAPAMAAGTYDITVTTTGGTKSLVGSYTYTNGIVVSPNTTPTATSITDLDITGVGFSKLVFDGTNPVRKSDGTAPNGSGAHVYIVQGTYDPTDDGNGAKTKGQFGECMNVLVISDVELICTLNTNRAYGQNGDSAIANGTYTITVVSNGGVDVQSGGANADANYTQSVISSGSTFTVAPY